MVNVGPLTAEICWRVWGTQQISTAFASLQCYCTAMQQWASAKLRGIEQRAPPIFGRVAIMLGIGRHSSPVLLSYCLLSADQQMTRMATCQPSCLHNVLQVYQPSRASSPFFSRTTSPCTICLMILVGAPSATALLQHGTLFLSPLKLFVFIQFQSPLKVLLYSPGHKQLTHSIWPPSNRPCL